MNRFHARPDPERTQFRQEAEDILQTLWVMKQMVTFTELNGRVEPETGKSKDRALHMPRQTPEAITLTFEEGLERLPELWKLYEAERRTAPLVKKVKERDPLALPPRRAAPAAAVKREEVEEETPIEVDNDM